MAYLGHAPRPDEPIEAARRQFFETGHPPEGLITAPILQSWQRCAAQGLQVGRPRFEPLPSQEIRAHQQRTEILRRLARPEIEALHSEAQGTDSVVILADASGLILDLVGSLDFADRASQVALRPGVSWSEEVMGTNAIGTAFIERRPIAVHGGEHFFEPHRILSCAAAPILDPRGQLLGVLDLSGHAAVRPVHALGLVRLAVEQIEHRLFDQGFEHCLILRFHQESALLGTAQEGVLVFEGDTLVAANRAAVRALRLDWSGLSRLGLGDLFPHARLSGDPSPWRAASGLEVIGRIAKPKTALRPQPPALRARPPAEPGPLLSADVQADAARAVRLLAVGIPILIQGETGTGKEVFARRVHGDSDRATTPFVAINCAALPETLIESELFGYEEGAFTGARRKGHRGLLRQADGGVLFLDEIGDMPLGLQARLLRVLQDRAIQPLGADRPIPVDFALICATHRPLATLVSDGRFRQDLFFRIAQYTVELPPLRRQPDRQGLLQALWYRLQTDSPRAELAPETVQHLAGYDWPGNYRQLLGVLRALLALAEPGRPIVPSDLPAFLRPNPPLPVEDSGSLAAITDTALRAALAAAGGNRSRAAQALGINRSTLYRRLRQSEASA